MPNFDGINNHFDYSTRTNLESKINRFNQPKKKRRWKLILIVLLLLGGVFVFAGTNFLSKANSIFTGKTNIFTRFGKLLVSDDKPLQGEEQGRINVLLLGMGGPGHEGPLLTDTMIVASIDSKTWEVGLISIPRDFMVKIDGRGYNKINAAYAFGEQDNSNGADAAIAAAEYVTGLDIPYYAAIDFKGFVKAVDHAGGLDITVDRTFTDSTYPNYTYGYLPPQTFTKGQEHMDGERALIFARSRHGNNGEGSDFARSERQKKIMLAMKDELKEIKVTDIKTLNNLLSDFTENFRTNFEPHELLRLAGFADKINGDNVYSLSLDPQATVICDGMFDLATGRPAPPLIEVPVITDDTNDEGSDSEDSEAENVKTTTTTQEVPGVIRAYVVVPCSGKTITDVHQYLSATMEIANLQKEDAAIEVQNSTGKTSVITEWKKLAELGLNVKFTTSKLPLDRTIIYDNTKGTKPKTLAYIKSKYNVTVSDLPYTQSTADFVIMIGNDAIQ